VAPAPNIPRLKNLVARAVTCYPDAPVFIAMGFLHPVAYILVVAFHKRENQRTS
jgi:hypothetical protein